ncbi:MULTISPECIES: SDR family NAD(P)-dependent oxidoreductase [unclassified Sphingomonas]|uniref:SDR family NAD(P)-dependent oxidoreductase n=1 Tax=Novosphingobium rhizosphaerae TaxID=1551649 RepID=UPI0015CE4730
MNTKGTALITGASTGIGAIYADRLAARGHDLILVARNKDKLQSLAATISDKTGRAVEVLAADLGNTADLARVETVLREDASISVLVNNAGIGTHTTLLESDVERMEAMVRLNVTALMRLTYAAVPGFVARGGGTVINIASIVAVAPELLNGVYGGSKAFVQAFTTSLNHELSAQGIRAQAVLPGATRTDFWALGGLPVEHLPSEIVMQAEDMVDAALAGLDQGETSTIPALRDVELWHAFEAARRALGPQLSATQSAPRFHAAA